MTYKMKKLFFILASLSLFLIIIISIAGKSNQYLLKIYKQRESVIVYDRNDEIISINPNQDGYYSVYSETIPEKFKEYLLFKEDKYFYSHFGINPVSTLGAVINYIRGSKNTASSTLTQQLVKILLDNTKKRNIKNKLIEAYYSISLELFSTKDEILKMYVNSVYLGNQIQGLDLASKLYFETTPALLNENEIIQIISTIDSPSVANPFSNINISKSDKLSNRIGLNMPDFTLPTIRKIKEKKKKFKEYISSTLEFELNSLSLSYESTEKLSIDEKLN